MRQSPPVGMDYATATPEAIAEAIAAELCRPVDAGRAALIEHHAGTPVVYLALR